MSTSQIIAVVPAAGIGSRMQSDIPKQYLQLNGQTILAHTLQRLLHHPSIDRIVVALHKDDRWFHALPIASHERIETVIGGDSRADSVISALKACPRDSWALVHDAARPCVRIDDITQLINHGLSMAQGGAILAAPVRDTMKRSLVLDNQTHGVENTVDRTNLWHALTPQLFPTDALLSAYQRAMADAVAITDEASAMEYVKAPVALIASHPGNIKITHPDDLDLAQFYLQQESL